MSDLTSTRGNSRQLNDYLNACGIGRHIPFSGESDLELAKVDFDTCKKSDSAAYRALRQDVRNLSGLSGKALDSAIHRILKLAGIERGAAIKNSNVNGLMKAVLVTAASMKEPYTAISEPISALKGKNKSEVQEVINSEDASNAIEDALQRAFPKTSLDVRDGYLNAIVMTCHKGDFGIFENNGEIDTYGKLLNAEAAFKNLVTEKAEPFADEITSGTLMLMRSIASCYGASVAKVLEPHKLLVVEKLCHEPTQSDGPENLVARLQEIADSLVGEDPRASLILTLAITANHPNAAMTTDLGELFKRAEQKECERWLGRSGLRRAPDRPAFPLTVESVAEFFDRAFSRRVVFERIEDTFRPKVGNRVYKTFSLDLENKLKWYLSDAWEGPVPVAMLSDAKGLLDLKPILNEILRKVGEKSGRESFRLAKEIELAKKAVEAKSADDLESLEKIEHEKVALEDCDWLGSSLEAKFTVLLKQELREAYVEPGISSNDMNTELCLLLQGLDIANWVGQRAGRRITKQQEALHFPNIPFFYINLKKSDSSYLFGNYKICANNTDDIFKVLDAYAFNEFAGAVLKAVKGYGSNREVDMVVDMVKDGSYKRVPKKPGFLDRYFGDIIDLYHEKKQYSDSLITRDGNGEWDIPEFLSQLVERVTKRNAIDGLRLRLNIECARRNEEARSDKLDPRVGSDGSERLGSEEVHLELDKSLTIGKESWLRDDLLDIFRSVIGVEGALGDRGGNVPQDITFAELESILDKLDKADELVSGESRDDDSRDDGSLEESEEELLERYNRDMAEVMRLSESSLAREFDLDLDFH